MEGRVIFVDANYFIRALTLPETPAEQAMTEAARELFRRAEQGEEAITTSEAVLAEVAFVLGSKRQYNLPAHEVAARMKTILLRSGLKLSARRTCLRALDLWSSMPRLGFVDALGAAYAETHGYALASFDTDFDRVPGIVRWQPSEEHGGTT
jgi:predicted nucleic acid-binding protein